MVTKWQFAPKKSDDLIEQILLNRGIGKHDHERFLKPNFETDTIDPFTIKGVAEATKRINRAIKNKQKIGIFADYDADGIPAAAILWETLHYLALKVGGPDPSVYVPSRAEGYGLNKQGIDELKKEGAKLLITVDLGIRSEKEVAYARKAKMDVIVIDHHLVGSNLPKAIVINPKQPGCPSIFKDYAAGGLAWKVAQALTTDEPNFARWQLDLAAISTISDMVPLVGENRLIAKYGLMVMAKRKRLGLRALLEVSGLKDGDISGWQIGFIVAPRINAPGRMDHASRSFYLLISRDGTQAKELAQSLNDLNLERQAELDRVLREARALVTQGKLDHHKLILVAKEGWGAGVVGLVAGRLTDEHHRPAIVLTIEDGVAKGSARSIDAFHLVNNLEKLKADLISFGGHARAAGVSLPASKLETFYRGLRALADKRITDQDLVPTITIDAEISPKELSIGLTQTLAALEPFGVGNPHPVLCLKNVVVKGSRLVGAEQTHLQLQVGFDHSQAIVKAIGFSMADQVSQVAAGSRVDLAFWPQLNTWQGRTHLDLKLVGLRKAE
ncbi:single-stranded-DNA-specific exonuclease RecJ [Candidatus Berkelbacteria bacterium]|nr:single-stranded-DNA-specific exonuclease RecJ [Candidatus Berkelbacteria bacterium]